MSHFYGTIQGARGEATRTGTKNSGMVTHAAGWGGAIRVDVYQDENGNDMFRVSLGPWQNSGGRSRTLAIGRLDANSE